MHWVHRQLDLRIEKHFEHFRLHDHKQHHTFRSDPILKLSVLLPRIQFKNSNNNPLNQLSVPTFF